jgi:hypothetical protein
MIKIGFDPQERITEYSDPSVLYTGYPSNPPPYIQGTCLTQAFIYRVPVYIRISAYIKFCFSQQVQDFVSSL